jgi:hypothetical protein
MIPKQKKNLPAKSWLVGGGIINPNGEEREKGRLESGQRRSLRSISFFFRFLLSWKENFFLAM